MLEHYPWALALADCLPKCGAERARALQPLAVGGIVLPVRQHAPVVEVLADDAAFGAERLTVLDLVFRRDDGDRNPARRLDDLYRLTAETAGTAPDEDDVA